MAKNYQDVNKKAKRIKLIIGIIILVLALGLEAWNMFHPKAPNGGDEPVEAYKVTLEQVNGYDGKNAVITINNNVPGFTEDEIMKEPYEFYSPLDDLKRCGVAFACACKETMPTQKRENISEIKPTGWKSTRYDDVEGQSFYNRSHLIAFMLCGENANKQNLITGTQYFNQVSMQTWELKVFDYIKATGNHVMYRVTPIFIDDELVARGVQMEAYSVEDNGKGICYNIFCYNVQPGFGIDYKTGNNWRE